MDADTSPFPSFFSNDLMMQQQMSSPHFSLDAPAATIKMEDLQQDPGLASAPPSVAESIKSSSPSASDSVSGDSKQVKKRKSWGQVLPEPKTNLPPRKRAKTEDEKEQRRIERVKRNRLAAHNSRERKRLEVENLQDEKTALENQIKAMTVKMEAMSKELETYRRNRSHSDVAASVEDSLTMYTRDNSVVNEPSTINPREPSFHTPESSPSLDSLDSPIDTATQPSTPRNEPTLVGSDQTQHSAAMLCDLQCPSLANKRHCSIASLSISRQVAMACLILSSLQAFWMSLLLSATSSTSRPFRTRPRRSLSTTRPKAFSKRRSHRTPSSAPPAFLATLMQSTPNCSPTLAQHLMFATGLASQPASSSRQAEMTGRTGVAAADCGDDDETKQEGLLRKVGLSSIGAQCLSSLGRSNSSPSSSPSSLSASASFTGRFHQAVRSSRFGGISHRKSGKTRPSHAWPLVQGVIGVSA